MKGILKKNGKLFGSVVLLLLMVCTMSLYAHADGVGRVRMTRCSANNNGTVSLKWDKVSGADGYFIYAAPADDDTPFEKVATAQGTVKKLTLTGLEVETNYVIYITAFKGDAETSDITEGQPSQRRVVRLPAPSGLQMPTNLTASNYNKRVVLRWYKRSGVEGYCVYQKKAGKWKKIGETKNYYCSIKKLTNNKKYEFKVCAYKTVMGKRKLGKGAEITAVPFNQNAKKIGLSKVHPFYYKATFKASYNAPEYKGSGHMAFRAGQNVTVTEQGSSRHLVEFEKKIYKVPKRYLTLTGFIWDHKAVYSKEMAVDFVNRKGYASATKYLIWINTYTQYLYLFQGSQYNWKCKFITPCSTGMWGKDEEGRATPTPIGISYVYGKQYDWWFAGDQVAYWASNIAGGAIHSWLYYPSGGKYPHIGEMGSPSSHGCVRIDKPKAKWIYDKCAVGTTVVVW